MTEKLLDWRAEVATVEAYRALRRAAGLSTTSPDATRTGLSRSLAMVCGYAGADLVAMARLIGDGGIFAQVTDVAVHPDFERRGHGTEAMRRLMAEAERLLPPSTYLSLIADDGAEKLYARFGFAPRTGMARRI